jgi:hypothetical protein
VDFWCKNGISWFARIRSAWHRVFVSYSITLQRFSRLISLRTNLYCVTLFYAVVCRPSR